VTIVGPIQGPATGSALARCAGEVDAFLASDWGARARMRRRDAGSRGFGDLLMLDDVDRFLTTTALRTPFFRLVQSGEHIPESAYTRSGRAGSRDVSGIADPAAVASLFEGGATIVLQGVHRWSEPVTRFCRDLELQLGHACQVNAYVTPAGAQGLDLHHDPHDVFVLQAFGRKRWQVHAAPMEAERPPLDVEVESGDTIYMPRGTPHAASAQDTVSGHLTVGVHVATWRDVVREAFNAATQADEMLDARLPAGWLTNDEAVAEELAARLRSATDRMASLDPRQTLERRSDRFLSRRAQLARGSIVERAAPRELHDDTVVRRRAGSVCEVRVQADELTILLGDRRLTMPTWLEPALLHVAASEELQVADLADMVPDPASRIVLVRRLIREGLLTAALAPVSDMGSDDPPSVIE